MTDTPVPIWIKTTVMIVGLLIASVGSMMTFGFCCALGDNSLLVIPITITLAAGGTMFWHGNNSAQKKPSSLMIFPPIWALVAVFGLLVVVLAGAKQERLFGDPVSPMIVLAAAALPPSWAVVWFFQDRPKEITWRRGLVALASGATISVLLAALLETLLPTIILALLASPMDTAIARLEFILRKLGHIDISAALTDPAFVIALVQLAVITPLVEELVKPLITLPVLRHLNQRQAFLVGALAGAGFAIVENSLYASAAYRISAGILLLRSIGCAIHPLGAGLAALAWRDILLRKENAAANWVKRFGAAVGLHALWNGGSLLVITLAGAEFFGQLSPEIDLLGISAAGATLAFLLVLGLAALWFGRRLAKPVEQASEFSFQLTDRTAAIWALACLAALVPLGITGLKILFR